MNPFDIPLSDEQQMLRHSLHRLVDDLERPSWRDLADRLGLGGVTLPEAHGGFGGGMVEVALVMAELGPALAGDWLSHAVAAAILARAAPDHAALSDLAAGTRRVAILCAASCASMPVVGDGRRVCGSAKLVAGAAEADLLLIADGEALLLLAADRDKVERRHRIMHDGSVSADLGFMTEPGDVAVLAAGREARTLADYANDMMLVGRCAEAVGLIKHMLADSIDYMGQRKQFGAAIARFQVLRHRIADMQLAAMKAGALTETAILAVERSDERRGAVVSAACVEVADAVRIIGEGAVQIHGAMGLTEELPLGERFRRGLAIAAAMGRRGDHLARFAKAAI